MADISSIGAPNGGSYRASASDRSGSNPADLARLESIRRERPADSVSLSDEARQAARSDIRTDLTSQVRRELEDGTYVTAEKLDSAVANLIDEILRG